MLACGWGERGAVDTLGREGVNLDEKVAEGLLIQRLIREGGF